MPRSRRTTASAPSPAAVRNLLDRGHLREALEAARRLHAHRPGADARALLAEAATARIRQLAAAGLDAEARALARALPDLDLADVLAALDVRAGRLDPLVAPLADPDLPLERRDMLHNALRRELTDLPALANCPALPAAHSLRQEAAALHQAFDRVTRGPVDAEAAALPSIARRSPLAAWKLLIRALAAFHRGDDAGCERALQAVPGDAAPTRLIPVLRALLSVAPPPTTRAAAALAVRVGGPHAALGQALADLDAHPQEPYPRVKQTVALCTETAPDRLNPLRQRLSIWGLAHRLESERMRAALGGPPRRDAAYWRLFARHCEHGDEPTDLFQACRRWAAFEAHARAEGWLPPKSPEAAALYLHMAGLLEQAPPLVLAQIRRVLSPGALSLAEYYRGQPPEIRAVYSEDHPQWYLDPGELFARAAAAHPDPATFQRWMTWTRSGRGGRPGDVARAWSAAFPDDVRPLVCAMEDAEQRGAFKQAEQMAEAAAALDPLHAGVRAARFRIAARSALRHLRQNKPHLVARDLPALDAARDPGRFAEAVRWATHVLSGDLKAAACVLEAAGRGHPAFPLLCISLARGVKLRERPTLPPPEPGAAASCVRALASAREAGLEIGLPVAWIPALQKEVEAGAADLDPAALLALGRAAFDGEHDRLAFAVSGAGLARGGADGRFLLLRGLALTDLDAQRSRECLAAAAELGRREGDVELVREALDEASLQVPFDFSFEWQPEEPEPLQLDEEKLRRVVERERHAAAFPKGRQRPQRGRPDRRELERTLQGMDMEELINALEAAAATLNPRRARNPGRQRPRPSSAEELEIPF